jgi:hypothetical protein
MRNVPARAQSKSPLLRNAPTMYTVVGTGVLWSHARKLLRSWARLERAGGPSSTLAAKLARGPQNGPATPRWIAISSSKSLKS